MTVKQFWEQQQFNYVVTYSFNRGAKLAALKHAAKELFKATRKQLLTASSAQLPALREQLRSLERTHDIDLLTLTEKLAAFHITAMPVAKIEKYAVTGQALASLMQSPVINQSHWMCGPIYRDALAFYDEQHSLVGVLNICFSCEHMLTDTGHIVQADTGTYDALRSYLIQLGHPITEGE